MDYAARGNRTQIWGALALVSILCAGCGLFHQEARGFPLYVASAPTMFCGDSYNLVVSAMGNHRFALNENRNIGMSELTRRLREILVHRAEKVVFVRAEVE